MKKLLIFASLALISSLSLGYWVQGIYVSGSDSGRMYAEAPHGIILAELLFDASYTDTSSQQQLGMLVAD